MPNRCRLWLHQRFSKLGFDFNPKFTDDKAACMIVSEEAFVMLMFLAEPFFRTFTKREPCDTSRQSQKILCVLCVSVALHTNSKF